MQTLPLFCHFGFNFFLIYYFFCNFCVSAIDCDELAHPLSANMAIVDRLATAQSAASFEPKLTWWMSRRSDG